MSQKLNDSIELPYEVIAELQAAFDDLAGDIADLDAVLPLHSVDELLASLFDLRRRAGLGEGQPPQRFWHAIRDGGAV